MSGLSRPCRCDNGLSYRLTMNATGAWLARYAFLRVLQAHWQPVEIHAIAICRVLEVGDAAYAGLLVSMWNHHGMGETEGPPLYLADDLCIVHPQQHPLLTTFVHHKALAQYPGSLCGAMPSRSISSSTSPASSASNSLCQGNKEYEIRAAVDKLLFSKIRSRRTSLKVVLPPHRSPIAGIGESYLKLVSTDCLSEDVCWHIKKRLTFLHHAWQGPAPNFFATAPGLLD